LGVDTAMSEDVVIKLVNIGKCYNIFAKPADRLKQMFWRNRRKYYSEYWALRDISFEIRRGEAIGIIGRNGAGKSTLLQIVTGTLEPTTGTVTRQGRVAALLELGAGFNPDFTGAENVQLAASLLGLTQSQIDARYDAIVEFAGIGDFLSQPVKLYSSGMYARLAFSVAAHVDADVLIVDETLSVGDAAFTQKCMRFFDQFRSRGTILFVSHDTGAVTRLCDRVIWLEDGSVRMEGAPKETSEAYLAATYAESNPSARFKFFPGSKPVLADDRGISLPANLPNPAKPKLEFFDFNPESAGFGEGGATICNVSLRAINRDGTALLEGGEEMELVIEAQTLTPLDNPILGFIVKDRLGQILFNRNTYASHPIAAQTVPPHSTIIARFHFVMPLLDNGEYSVSSAIADGTVESHTQHHWLHDSLIFRVSHAEHGRGLIGVQMLGVDLHVTSHDPMPSQDRPE